MGRGRGPAVVALLVVSTLWFVGSATPAHTCSCLAPQPEPTEWERLQQADIVIVGRATAVTEHPGPGSGDPGSGTVVVGDGRLEYAFAVEHVHKGEVPAAIALWTSDSDGMCGFGLPLGELYKLYPYRQEDGTLWIGLCSGNRVATEADLQPIAPPATEPPPTTEPPPDETTAPVATATTLPPTSTTDVTTTSTTAAATTSTTEEPDDESAIAVSDEDLGGGGGGAGWLVAGGGATLAGAAAVLLVWRVRRGRGAGDDGPSLSPEPPAAP